LEGVIFRMMEMRVSLRGLTTYRERVRVLEERYLRMYIDNEEI